jgi:trimeric autotransporter adhesin
VKTKRLSPSSKSVKKSRPSAVAQALEQRVLFSADVAALALLPTATQPAAQVQSQPSTPISTNATTQNQAISQLFVLDLRIADAQGLLAGLQQQQAQARANGETFEILTLDWQDDGITKISDALSAQGSVSALHLIGHGDDGMMLLGSTWLDQATLRNRASDFSAWSQGFSDQADILIYGCNFAENQIGQQSVRSLAQITGADVAASIDSTANIAQGGNWFLEHQQGAIEANTTNVELAAIQWQGKLATFVVTNNANLGAGSLRQAIINANNANGSDTITFNIGVGGVQNIGLQSALPQVTEGVLIDGTTQTGYAVGAPLIVLNGSIAGSPADGIVISSTTPVTIRGLVINRFQGSGIVIFGGGSNVLTGNFIGIDETGNTARSNGGNGIYIYNSSNNIIGGTTAALRNVVSANIGAGIEIDSGSNGTIIQGNFVGTNATGTAPLGNTFDGILLGASSNATVGGTAIGAGNVVSGNLQNGLGLYTSGGNHTILGNIIGLNAQGTAAIANGQSGIAISQSNANIIGSTAVGGRNIISGNTNSGIYLVNTSNNTIVSNFIGRNSTNTNNIGNQSGVSFATGANNNRLGGFGTNEGNLIVGSTTRGVDVSTGAVANAILANTIFSSGGLGIDLGTDGITQNDMPLDADTGANGLQNFPMLYNAVINGSLVNITGELTSTANTTFAIQFFSTPFGTEDGTGHGEAAAFLGYATVTTNGAGFASINASFSSAGLSVNDRVVALASIDLGSGIFGSTSEFSLNIVASSANTAPLITNLGGDILAYAEGDGPVKIDTGSIANVSDSDSADFDTGQLTIRIAAGFVTNEDRLSIQNQGTGTGQIGVTGTTVYFEGISIGSLSTNVSGSTMSIAFNQNATTTATAALIRAIAYENTNFDTPSPGARTIIVNLNDGDGATSSDYSVQVNVTAVNDPPNILFSPTSALFSENGQPIFIDPLLTLSDVDSPDFDGGILQLNVIANSSPSDVLAINNQGMSAGQVGVSGNSVFFGGMLIGTYSSTSANITVNLNANATSIEVMALSRNFTFAINGHDPVTLTRQATLTLNDGDGGAGTAATKSIAINIDNTLWVSTALDTADGDTSSMFNLLANRGADGLISLREAIIATNNTSNLGQNQINFDIPSPGTHRINLLSELPQITRTVVIEGRTQLGYSNSPLIEINGTALTEANGLVLAPGSSGSTIRGLAITNFLGTASPGGHGLMILSSNNVIQSNYLGIDTAGITAGNWAGLVVTGGATFNLIGGSIAGQGNVISGNTLGGVSIGGIGTSFNRIEGNFIGVGADAITSKPNASYGVNSWASGDGNVLGGTAGGAGNTISANNNVGIVVQANSTITILGNSISGNDSLAIDLTNDGLTANDLNDTDTGANGLQNYPVITSVTSTGGNTTILGGFNSRPNQTFRVEYFSSPTADAAGFGGGKTLIGSVLLTTGADGNANINSVLSGVSVPIGYVVSATATQDFGSSYGGTSEFAKSVAVNSVFPGAIISPLSATVTSESGTSVTFTIRLSTAPTGTVTIPISSDKVWEGSVNTASVTFTTANWNIDQTVTVTGVDDSVIDGSHNYNVVFGDAVSSDLAYNLMMLPPIAVSNIDNDTVSMVVVNTTVDIADGDTSSLYALIRNQGADGKISLREAIQATNNTPNGVGGTDQIQFNISDPLVSGEHVITLTSALPTITEAVIIEAYSEPDYALNGLRPIVAIDGNDIAAPIIHFGATADSSLIAGLILRNSAGAGVLIDSGSDNNAIVGTYIGNLRNDGTSAGSGLGNVTGIDIRGAGNVIGGVNAGDRNVISGNSDGVVIQSVTAANNFVMGNYIGTTATGNTALGNTFDGVRILSGATGNTIGGDTASRKNIISGNLGEGVEINGATTSNNIVRGNYIGVSADGLSNITPVTNSGTGIYIVGGADNTLVGGSVLGQGNWIAGLHFGGVVVDGTSSNTVIQGNRIGTDASGTLNWGTGFNAVLIENGAASTLIGGTTASAGNILANSGQISTTWTDGLTIIGTGTNNAALGNSIYGSVGEGIDLGNNGVTNNDVGDADSGVNGLQNYPVLASAVSSGGNTTITGALNSNANTSYRIEFFSSPIANSSGHGEAKTYLGFVNTTTNASGNANFNTTLSGVTLSAGAFVSSTATIDLGSGNFGSTSEFSTNTLASTTLSISGTVYEDINSNGQVADDGIGLGGAIVSLYLDNGDGVIGAGDTIVNNIAANASGQYSFTGLAAGTYWVVVDSRTLRSNSGLMPTATTLDQWAEQTYGSVGSVSWNAGVYNYAATSGVFLGGMRTDRSDNGASLPTAEHVTKVSIAGVSVTSVDYGFSYNVITNARDGDDVAANNLTIQGSLRQFVQNSNALVGVQSSQFRIPTSDPNVTSGVAVVSLTSALPTLNDTIVIDGTTQTTWGGNTNSGLLGTGGNVGYNPVGLSQVQAPEIEIRDLTTSPNIFKILGNNTIIRGLAILGGGTANNTGNAAIEVSANSVTIVGNIIGSSATAIADPGAANRIQSIGVRVLGQATIDNNIFAYIPMHAVSVEAGGSNSSVYNNEFISPALTSNTQAAVAVRDAVNVQINGNLVRNSGGNAIELYFNADSNLIRDNSFLNGGTLPLGDDNAIDITGGSDNNIIEGNLISGHVGSGIAIGNSAGNKIGGIFLAQGNQIINNGGAGIVLTTTAQGNQSILRNSIYNNGGIGIDLGNDGVTLNDAAPDSDAGPNGLQNFPTLAQVVTSMGNTSFTGSIYSTPNTAFRIEFFSSVLPNSSGFGEGQSYLGSTTVTTDATGFAAINVTLLGIALPPNTATSATATVDLGAGNFGNTSEFSAITNSTTATPGISTSIIVGASTTESGGTATFTVVLDAAPLADVAIPLSLSNALEASLSTSSITFTSSNWNIAQTITITGLDDGIIDGNVGYQVIRGLSTSSDAAYNGIAVTTLNLTNIDNDTYNTIVVNTVADIDDGDTSSIAALFANQGADGRISLREAIIAANNTANGPGGSDRIYFNISDPLINGAHTINVASALPKLSDGAIIDAHSEPDFATNPIVELVNVAGVKIGLEITASNTEIRGLAIGLFTQDGIRITSGAANTVVAGNNIGTDSTGTIARGNGDWGIHLNGAGSGTIIGGSSGRNIISNSQTLGGILLNNTSDIQIINNLIGVASDGVTAMANVGDGILTTGSTTNVTIGGVTNGLQNTISNSTVTGIALQQSGAGVAILGNVITNSGSLGIDIGKKGGVLVNDNLDGDTGTNGKQNYPVLSSANIIGSITTITGAINSTPNTALRIEFFSNPTGDPSGYGEGSVYIGFTNLTTDAQGNANINVVLSGASISTGNMISATATVDLGGGNYSSTSEFSQNVLATGNSAGVTVSPVSGNTSEAGATASFTVVLNSAPAADVTISVTSSITLEGVVSTSQLTFTSANWNVAQTVTVTGVNEALVDGNHAYTIVLGNAVSVDANYNGMNVPDVNIINVDNDTQSTITVSTTNDVADGDTSSLYALQSNKGADGVISLREAILAANNSTNGSGGADKINFNIADPLVTSAHTISLNSALPFLTDSVIIDGYSEPDSLLSPSAHVVVIDGNNLTTAGFVITSTASDSTIRGMVIQGFGWHGIEIQLGSTNNTIAGNYIGQLTAQGTDAGASKVNGGSGIHVQGFNNRIGGVTAADRNVIAGNYAGVTLRDGTNNTVTGNYIGTDATGTTAIANRDSGIYIEASTGNVIGGASAGMGNLISGNAKSGIYLFTGANSNSIQGNYIGTDVTGTVALGNNLSAGTYYGGVTAENVSGTLIGGNIAGAGNLISGNTGNGISSISGGSGGAVIAGNIIGLASDGQTLLGNSGNGINVETGNLRIGGATTVERNIISGNTQSGIRLTSASANNNIVSGNYIGTDATGSIARGNLSGGVQIVAGANNNTIGGLTTAAGNVISGNTFDGVLIGTSANNNSVQANLIGIAANGSIALANSGAGVYLYDGATNNLVGGTASGATNKIAFNGTSGILLSNTGALSRYNAFLGNQIFSNATLGIDFAPNGIYANDLGDADTGVNDLQNFPVLTTVVSTGGNTTITGTFNSTANKSFRLEFFTTPTGAMNGHGDANTFIGTIDVTTDAAGNASFNSTYSGVTLTAGHIVTATATLKVNATQFSSTSGFAQNIAVVAALPGITVTPPTTLVTSEAGITSQFTVVLNSAPTADVTIALTTSNAAEGSLSTNLLTFTNLNWNIAQTITVTGVNDSFVDGTKIYTIATAPAVSADLSYNGLDAGDIVMSNTDNDLFNTLVVDTTSDASDGDTSSIAALYANKGSDGKISLREAILAANNTVNGSQSDLISFNITDPLIAGAHTINAMSVLPSITDAVLIDGTTEPDYTQATRVISLNGSGAGSASGLVITLNGTQIIGIAISGFSNDGIQVTGNNNAIVNNLITNNTGAAIYVGALASNINIASNTISNQTIGVVVTGTSNGVSISQNTMDTVGQLIDLGFDGMTANDLSDIDMGANGLQNTPVISSVSTDGFTQLGIVGSFNGLANRTITIEVFEHGTVGQSLRSHYVGSLSVTTDGAGNANFNQIFNGAYAAGTLFSLTSTDATVISDRPTSEHSDSAAAQQTAVVISPTTGLLVTEGGSTATFSVSLSTAPTADVVFTLAPNLVGEVFLSANTITFTNANWNIPQIITITGVQDFVNDGTKNIIIVTSNTTSADINFNGLKVADIAVANSEIANIAPVITSPASYAMIEDNAGNLGGASTGLNISDLDAGNGLLSVTISVSNGLVSLGSQAGLVFSTGDGTADTTMTFQGSVSAINSAIDAIAFAPNANFSGSVNLTISVNDLGNSGTGGPLSTIRVIPINIAPVNDAPVLTGAKTATVLEGGAVLISASMLNLTDIDNTSSDLVFTIKAIDAQGEFMRSGVSLRIGDSFTQADIDSQLIQYSNFGSESPTATVTLSASERFGIQLADFDMQFSVAPVNDVPAITSISGAAISEVSSVGMPVAFVSAADADNAGGLVFSLVNDAQGAFQINATTGTITVLNPALIDYETATQHIIRVKVADSFGAAAERDFVVQISDVAEFVLPPTEGGGTESTGGGNPGTGGPTTGGSTTTDGSLINPSTGLTGVTQTDTSNQPTSTGNVRSETPSTTATNSEARRGTQTKQIEIDKEVWVDPSALVSNVKKQTDAPSKSVINELLEQQQETIERNRRRLLNSDVLDLLLSNNRKDRLSGLAPPNVILGEFKLPSNAQSMPISEGSIDSSRSNKTYSVVIDTIEYSGMALSVGAVAWATRAGGLIAALISAVPAWKGLDPLLVLSPTKADKEKEFEEFSDTELRGDEEAVRAVL